MKTIQCKSFFKKVSAKQAEANPALADKVGVKRADCDWSFAGYAGATDLESVSAEHIVFFLNKAIEDHGRALVSHADNSANWDYIPSQDDLTLAAAYEAATAETSRARVLTKVTATMFAKFYSKHAPELLDIKKEAALAAEGVLAEWLKYSKKDDLRKAMHARLSQFADVLAELDEDSPAMADFIESDTDLAGVLSALINAFSEDKSVVEITADAL
jgi:hypothetical protein